MRDIALPFGAVDPATTVDVTPLLDIVSLADGVLADGILADGALADGALACIALAGVALVVVALADAAPLVVATV